MYKEPASCGREHKLLIHLEFPEIKGVMDLEQNLIWIWNDKALVLKEDSKQGSYRENKSMNPCLPFAQTADPTGFAWAPKFFKDNWVPAASLCIMHSSCPVANCLVYEHHGIWLFEDFSFKGVCPVYPRFSE